MVVRGLLNYLTEAKKQDARWPATVTVDIITEASENPKDYRLLFDLKACLPFLVADTEAIVHGGDLSIILQRLSKFITQLARVNIKTSWFVEVPGCGLLDCFPFRNEENIKEQKHCTEIVRTTVAYASANSSMKTEVTPNAETLLTPLLISLCASALRTCGVTFHICTGDNQAPLGPWEDDVIYVVSDNIDFAVTKGWHLIPTKFFDLKNTLKWGANLSDEIPVSIEAEYTSPEVLSKHFQLGYQPKQEWGKGAQAAPPVPVRRWWVERALTELCLLIGTESTLPVLEKNKIWKKCDIEDSKNIPSIAKWFRDQVYGKKLRWQDIYIEDMHTELNAESLQYPIEYSRAIYSCSTRGLARLYSSLTEWKLKQQQLGFDCFLRQPKTVNTYSLTCFESIMGLRGFSSLGLCCETTQITHQLLQPLREALYLLNAVVIVEEKEFDKQKKNIDLQRDPFVNFYAVLSLWTPEQKANFVLALCSARVEKKNDIDIPAYFRQIIATTGEVEPTGLNLSYVAAAYMATLNVDIDGAKGNVREHEFDTVLLSLMLCFQSQTEPQFLMWKERLLVQFEARHQMSCQFRFSERGIQFMSWWQNTLRLFHGMYEVFDLPVPATSLLSVFNPNIFVPLYVAGAWEQWELPVPEERNRGFMEINHWAEGLLQVRWEMSQHPGFQAVKSTILSWLSARDYTPEWTKCETAAPLGPAINEDALPIDLHRDRITEHIFNHRITCIQGETGCGKSTRVPVYVLEHARRGGKLPPRVLQKRVEYEKEEGPVDDALISGFDSPSKSLHSLDDPPEKRISGVKDGLRMVPTFVSSTEPPPDDGAPEPKVELFRKARIMVTQPRRIACISLAKRVAEQIGEGAPGRSVGYQISGDSTASRHTEIVYVTTGYLLQVLVNDPTRLKEFSHLILDEVHERDVDSDLVNLVVKLQLINYPFHLVIMSATLQGDLFGRYFCEGRHRVKPIYVGAKRYPVETVFLEDIIPRYDSMKSMTDPTGMTGQSARFSDVVNRTVQRTVRMFNNRDARDQYAQEDMKETKNEFASSGESGTESDVEPMSEIVPAIAKVKTRMRQKVQATMAQGFDILVKELVSKLRVAGESILIFFPGIGEITEIHEILMPLEEESNEQDVKINIFVLHSLIPKDEQELAVFSDPPPDRCHVILASNIAESSLTLPKVRIVIDFGLRRQLIYDARRHMSCLVTTWVSQASAKQRMGRTGRVFQGTCIRLYSKQFFEMAMDEFDPPEMQTAPLEKLYINVKVLSHKLPEFIVPGEKKPRKLQPRELLSLTAQPPDTSDLDRAVTTLEEMGAITSFQENADLTLLGHLMLALPTDIYLCRMIIYGHLLGCVSDAIILASVLSAQDPFTLPSHLVIKNPSEYAEALLRSFRTRQRFDNNMLSEPIMLRNLFVNWLTNFNEHKASSRERRWGRETPRSSYLRFSQQFSRGHALVPKRCVHLVTSVLDTATRFRKFLVDESKACAQVDKLLDMMSPRFVVDKNDELAGTLFANDMDRLRILLAGSFSPNFMLGGTKIRGPNQMVAYDPYSKKKKKSQKQELTKMELLFDELLRHGMNPINAVVMPLEVPRWIRKTTERLTKDFTETLEMMLSVGEDQINNMQRVRVLVDRDWKKIYVEVYNVDKEGNEVKVDGSVDAKPEIKDEKDEKEDKEDKEDKEKKEKKYDAFNAKGAIEIQSVPTTIHLMDQFGAGRFKFQVNLIDTEWKEKQAELLRIEQERVVEERRKEEQLRKEKSCKLWFKKLQGQLYDKLVAVLENEDREAATQGLSAIHSDYVEQLELLRELELERWFKSLDDEKWAQVDSVFESSSDDEEKATEGISKIKPGFSPTCLPKLREMHSAKRQKIAANIEAMTPSPIPSPSPEGSPAPAGSPMPSTPPTPSLQSGKQTPLDNRDLQEGEPVGEAGADEAAAAEDAAKEEAARAQAEAEKAEAEAAAAAEAEAIAAAEAEAAAAAEAEAEAAAAAEVEAYEEDTAVSVTMYRPVSAMEVHWDVFTPSLEAELKTKGGKRKKTSSKGRCSWRNILGYLCSTLGVQKSDHWAAPNPPTINEIAAVFTSQQGSEQGGVMWLDGVTVITDLPLLSALLIAFTPHVYPIWVTVSMDSGDISSLSIGDSTLTSYGLKIDDLSRISDLRTKLSDGYLGTRSKKRAVVEAENKDKADDENANDAKAIDEKERKSKASEIHEHRVDIEENDLSHPFLDDADNVQEALFHLIANLGAGDLGYAQMKDTHYEGNIQQSFAGDSFRILRPLKCLMTERTRREKEYLELKRVQEEERKKKEEEKRRRKEEERQRKIAEEKRKQEAARDARARKKEQERLERERVELQRKEAKAQALANKRSGGYQQNRVATTNEWRGEWDDGDWNDQSKGRDWEETDEATWWAKAKTQDEGIRSRTPPSTLAAGKYKGGSSSSGKYQSTPASSSPPQEPPLLPDWKAVLDKVSKKEYYWNTKTNSVTWDRPSAYTLGQPRDVSSARNPQGGNNNKGGGTGGKGGGGSDQPLPSSRQGAATGAPSGSSYTMKPLPKSKNQNLKRAQEARRGNSPGHAQMAGGRVRSQAQVDLSGLPSDPWASSNKKDVWASPNRNRDQMAGASSSYAYSGGNRSLTSSQRLGGAPSGRSSGYDQQLSGAYASFEDQQNQQQQFSAAFASSGMYVDPQLQQQQMLWIQMQQYAAGAQQQMFNPGYQEYPGGTTVPWFGGGQEQQ